MKVQKDILENVFGLISFKSNFKLLIIFNFLISVFIFDLVKAESNNASLNSNTEIATDYLNSKNELEDYIVDTGDSLFIEFKNKPRGIELIEKTSDPENLSYLNPRSDLRNYRLDKGDVLDIKFLYVPEFNSPNIPEANLPDLGLPSFRQYLIDQEGEIYLPELGPVYVKGLNIYQAKDLLEKKYEKYLKLTDMEIRINKFRFISSGIYTINNQGELMLPLINETYVRGLTKNEISNLLSKRYLELENISTEVEIRISHFKPQTITISGEVRKPGIYKFSGFSAGDFIERANIDEEEQNKKNENSNSKVIDGNKKTKGEFKIRKLNASFNQDGMNNNNNIRQKFEIIRPDKNLTTISKLLKKAGGITAKTDLSRIEIIRDMPIGKGGGKQKAVIDLTSFLNGRDPTNDIRLFNGDNIFLPELTSASPDLIPKSILSGISPKFITVSLFGRVENPGNINIPLQASLSDAINLTGPIKPLSGKIVLIRYNQDGTVLNKNISYSARAKKGSARNPFLEEGDLITVKNSLLGKGTGWLKEFTQPFIGIYTTREVMEGF